MRSLWASLPYWVNGELELLQFHNSKHHTLGLIRERDRNGAINLITSIIFLNFGMFPLLLLTTSMVSAS